MPGKILLVEVKQGDRVSRGQTVVILEAMKMKNAIKAPYDGVVLEIMVCAEQIVSHGDPLAQLGRNRMGTDTPTRVSQEILYLAPGGILRGPGLRS